MKRNRCIFSLIFGILFTVVLSGCLSVAEKNNENHIDNGNGNIVTPVVTNQIETPTPAPDYNPDSSSHTDIPKIKEEIIIYSLNSGTLEKVALTINIDNSDFELTDLLKKITAALEDESFLVSVRTAYFDKTTAIVDFTENGAPGNVASNYEAIILDCISQSIIENYDECTAVIFRINGSEYKTQNFSLNVDEAYMVK